MRVIIFLIMFFSAVQAQFQEKVITAERNPWQRYNAKQTAMVSSLPVKIYIPGMMMAEALFTEQGDVFYAVYTNFLHPLRDGFIARYAKIAERYDLSKAYMNFGNGHIINKHILNLPEKLKNSGADLLLIPDSSDDRVLSFDPATGSAVNANFIPASADYFSTPLHAMSTPWGNVVVSDQLDDVVYEFDSDGNFLRIFAPKDSANTAILDNIRGINFKDDGNLVVSVASGANAHAVAEFDDQQIYLGNFIENGVGGISSPWVLIFRDTDCLLTTSTSDMISSHDKVTGAFKSVFASGISFPQQVTELSNGDIAVANFSGGVGVYVYSSSGGTAIRQLTGATGLRGVYELANGNLLVTNGTGVHEIDIITGNATTILSGISARLIGEYTAAEAVFAVSPDSLTFETVSAGTSITDSVMVANDGSVDLNIDSVFVTNANFSVLPDSALISSGDSMYVKVTFDAPLNAGVETGYLVFNHNGVSQTDSVYLYADVVTDIPAANSEKRYNFELFDNYPNPFNPATQIPFSIPEKSEVIIKIYDITGKFIESYNGVFNAGRNEYSFNAEKNPSGIYFYKIKNGAYQAIGKMILLR